MSKRIIVVGLGIFVISLVLMAFQNKYQHFFPGKAWDNVQVIHIHAHGGGLLIHENTYYWPGKPKIEGREGTKAYSSPD